MLTVTLAALWFSIGLLVGIIHYKIVPLVKHMRAAKRAKQQKPYPRAYQINKPYTITKS